MDGKQTFDLTGGITLTMHRPLGEDEMQVWAIITKIAPNKYEQVFDENWYNMLKERYANAMVLMDKLDGMDFERPTARDNNAIITDGFLRWMKLSKPVLKEWMNALVAIDEPLNDKALLPGDKVSDKTLADPLSGELEQPTLPNSTST